MKGSDNPFPSVLYAHTSNASISAPAVYKSRMFFDGDGTPKYKNSAGTVTALATGSAMTNPMTTAEDIIKSSDGSGTPARLALGASNSFLGASNSTLAYVPLSLAAQAPASLNANAAPSSADNFAAGWRRGSIWIVRSTGATYMMTEERPGSTTWTQLDGAGGGGSVATDAIWDAAGDLAVGSGANTAARLALGASGTVPTSNGSTLAYAYPPGYQVDYVEKTSLVTVTGTNDAGATTIVSGTSMSFANVAHWIEAYFPQVFVAGDDFCLGTLWVDSTDLGRLWYFAQSSNGADDRIGVFVKRLYTPSAGTHQFHIKAFKNSGGSAELGGGAGGTGNLMPGYIRITLA